MTKVNFWNLNKFFSDKKETFEVSATFFSDFLKNLESQRIFSNLVTMVRTCVCAGWKRDQPWGFRLRRVKVGQSRIPGQRPGRCWRKLGCCQSSHHHSRPFQTKCINTHKIANFLNVITPFSTKKWWPKPYFSSKLLRQIMVVLSRMDETYLGRCLLFSKILPIRTYTRLLSSR